MKSYILEIKPANVRFSIQEVQAKGLSDGAIYQIYYIPDNMETVSLARLASR